MYYLEDNHPEYEYTVYVKCKSGVPYIGVWRATSMMEVHREIKEIEKKHSRRGEHFYIDNDFYKNEYAKTNYVYYYRFMERKVNDWKPIKTQKQKSLVA